MIRESRQVVHYYLSYLPVLLRRVMEGEVLQENLARGTEIVTHHSVLIRRIVEKQQSMLGRKEEPPSASSSCITIEVHK